MVRRCIELLYDVPEKVLAKDTETTPAQEITRLLKEDYRMAYKFSPGIFRNPPNTYVDDPPPHTKH